MSQSPGASTHRHEKGETEAALRPVVLPAAELGKPVARRKAGGLGHAISLVSCSATRCLEFLLRFRIDRVAVCALAFFLRLRTLGGTEAWWDEGWSAAMSQRAPLDIVQRTATDYHPPLHYLYLHAWMRLAGDSEFALRFASVICGVVAVALVGRIGTRLLGRTGGTMAALLLAVAPFSIDWSQQIRMYPLALVLTVAATERLLAARDGSRLAWVGYIVTALACLFTAYITGLLLVLVDVGVLGASMVDRRGRRRFLFGFAIANVVLALAFAPWLVYYLRQTHGAVTAGTALAPLQFVRLCLSLLASGAITNVKWWALVGLAPALLVLLGLVKGFRRRHDLVAVSVPLISFPVILYLLSLLKAGSYPSQVADRYLLLILPAYVIALAAGLKVLWASRRAAGLAATVVVLGVMVSTLPGYYAERHSDHPLAALGTFVASMAGPRDLVVLNPDQDWTVFSYYLGPSIALKGLPFRERMTTELADHWLMPWAKGVDTVWLITPRDAAVSDPGGAVRAWLSARYRTVASTAFGQTTLTLYSQLPDPAVLHVRGQTPAVWQRASMTLPGADLTGFTFVAGERRGGDVIRAGSLWSATGGGAAPIETRLILAKQSGANPVVAGDWASDVSSVPAQLSSGEEAMALAALPIPKTVPPGHYLLSLQARAGEAVSTQQVGIRWISVQQESKVEQATAPASGDVADLGDEIRLLSYEVDTHDLRPGGSVRVTLHWQAQRLVEQSFSVFVHLSGTDEHIVAQADRVPQNGTYPTTNWATSEIVSDEYELPIPPTTPAGEYKLFVGMYDPTTMQRLPVRSAAHAGGSDRVLLGTLQME